MLTPESCQWLRDALGEVFADRTLRPHDKLVMLALAHHGYSRAGECWPSFDTIAGETGLSRSSVIRTIARLVQAKRIHRTQRPRPGNRHESNVYRVGGVGVTVTPTWVSGRHPNRISTERSSLLSISESSSLPPGKSEGAAVCSFVPAELIELAETLFGEHRRRLVLSSLRRLVRELGDEVRPEELARFLRYQARHRNMTGLGAPITQACEPAEFRKWQRRRAAAPERDDVAPPPTRGDRTRNALAATAAREMFKAARASPSAARSRPGGP